MAYKHSDAGISRFDKDGNEVPLSNFDARIEEEIKYVDGRKSETYYQVKGWNEDEKFPSVTVSVSDFAGMKFVSEEWGIGAIVYPVSNAASDLKTAIQIESRKKAKKRTVYTSTGWVKDGKKDLYLCKNGGITAKGINPQIAVELPNELRYYEMPIDDDVEEKEAVKNSLELRLMASPEIIWPILAATYRSAIGGCDFAVHVTGRTGTFKSEITSIMQSHYGSAMDARHLPASWSSTANALEALAYRAKDALIVIDDFIPMGTSWQQKQYQKTADQLVRGQGNQAGRSRLTDTSKMQSTMYPRGLILSTGEDTPEGHSVRGRMMIIELSPGDIKRGMLSEAQDRRGTYAYAMRGFIRWIAENRSRVVSDVKEITKEVRDQNIDVGHSRTPSMVGSLIAGVQMFLEYAMSIGVLKAADANSVWEEARDAILAAGEDQERFLIQADPVDNFIVTLRSMLQSGQCHVRTTDGGIPIKATALGWTQEESSGSLPTYKSNGTKIGWADWDSDSLYLDNGIVYDQVKRASRGGITLTKQTMFRRLREAGKITKSEEQRGRNTCRVACEGSIKQVLCLSLSQTLELQEKV